MRGSSDLFEVVRAAVGQFTCPNHNREYTRLRNFELLCEECAEASTSQKISEFFEQPLLSLVGFYSPLKVFDPQTLTSGFLSEVRKNLCRSETALNACLTALEKSVVAQCKFMKEAYARLSGQSIRKLEQHLGYLEGVNRIYLDYFYEKLGTAELTRSEHVAGLLKEFITGSEDPINSLTIRLEYIRDIIRDFPFLKMDGLKRLYSETCDPAKWQLSNFMQNAAREQETLVETNVIKLLDRQHLLRFDEKRLQILNLKNQVVYEELQSVDLCIEIDKFRLVMSNGHEIGLYSYLNPEQLKKLGSIAVRYPMCVRYRNGHVYFVSQGKLQKYHIENGTLSVVVMGKVKEYKFDEDLLLVMNDRAYELHDEASGKSQIITKQHYLETN